MDGKAILVSARDIARIKSSLRIIVAFEKEGIRYRVMGSLILAAINRSAHRPIGDIDLILDVRDRKKVLEILKRNGLRLKKNTKYGFSWIEASSPRHILFTLLLVGRFRDGRFTYRVSKNVSMSILEEYLSPRVYDLYGFSFIGIPARLPTRD